MYIVLMALHWEASVIPGGDGSMVRPPLLRSVAVLALAAGCDDGSASVLIERPGAVKNKGLPLTLLGPGLKEEASAPEFVVVDTDLRERRLSEFRGKVVILNSVPSLDTPVCNLQTRRFNQEAAVLGPDVAILTLSVDLPFAMKRWCREAGADRGVALSDYRERAFGKAYGLLIKESLLLARAVLVGDRVGVIRLVHVVREQTQEPSYERVLSVVKGLLRP